MSASLSGLHPYVRAKAEQLVANANKRIATGGHKVRIVQAYRSKATQNKLYAQGRTTQQLINAGVRGVTGKPNLDKVTDAKGGMSMHEYGLAVDFCLVTLDGRRISWDTRADFDKDRKADWMEVVEEAKKLGFSWGGDWTSFKDMPHFQMLGGLTQSQVRAGRVPKFPKVSQSSVPAKKTSSKPVYPGKALQKGSKNKNVGLVQSKLGLKQDNAFGPGTEKAVKKFQKSKGITQTGTVGPTTWKALF